MTQRPAGISGYTVKLLNTYGPLSATAAQANVAAPAEPVSVSVHNQSNAAVVAATIMTSQTTARYPPSANAGAARIGKPTGWIE